MPEKTELHLILSAALQTDDLSLEHDTVVVSPELTKRVTEALCASAANGGRINAVAVAVSRC
jgi:hypothetical protein